MSTKSFWGKTKDFTNTAILYNECIKNPNIDVKCTDNKNRQLLSKKFDMFLNGLKRIYKKS